MATHANQAGTNLHEALRTKQPVRAASVANVSLSAPGAAIDGVTLASGDRILLKDQTTASQNGIYLWTGAAAALTRTTDATSAADFVFGFMVYVREGTANGATNWQFTQSAAVTIGTTALTFTKIGAGAVTSVALTMPADFTVGGSPVTGAGTLAVTAANQTANTVKAGPTSGGAAAPTYRALVPADVPVFVASGASHAAGAVPDPGASAGTTKFLREDATFAVPPGSAGAGGSGVPLSNSVAADVTMTTASTYYDGPSISLPAGTWFLSGNVTLSDSASAANFTAKLWDGASSVLDSGESYMGAAGGSIEIHLSGFITLASTTTYKISATDFTNSATGRIRAAAPQNGAGNNASTLTAIPVFGYSQSASAAAVATSGTITTAGVTEARVSPAGAVTGVILQAGTYAGQQITVVNEAVAANSVTFAASGTSNVADGTSSVIPGLRASTFTWNSVQNLWYRAA